ncbi:hypothetical protein PPSIR1_23434 [Plesiocystis pacifica SIR-1]|uniref:PNPLA domain-containing protein n=1 Tax=Plesiocystis pacifica SIR-1 TaxID=391625 RepID=A6G7S9_9BACT|nr:patatin-like phospholipase family protein [Plesiocystis pacifica]EDM78022.1 hypothetical protein PPSIR1_23434 [Plesiocystis pacifica SIR-1]
MQLVTLADPEGRYYVPASDNTIGPSASLPGPESVYLVENLGRPGKILRTGNRLTLRHLATNRLVAMDRGKGCLVLTHEQRDHHTGTHVALLRALHARTHGGLLRWRLADHGDEHGAAAVEVIALDRSSGARILGGSGALVRAGADVRAVATRGEVLNFHPAAITDVRDIHDGQLVWLSIGGHPLHSGNDDADEAPVEVGSLRRGPLQDAWWGGRIFRVQALESDTYLSDGQRFRLRETVLLQSSERRALVLRNDRLMVAAKVADDDPSSIFTYASLVDLDLNWAGSRLDNATLVDPPREEGFRRVRTEGRVFVTAQVGTIPLKEFCSKARRDIMTTATAIGQEQALEAGYSFRGVVGWVWPSARPGTVVARQYWSGARGDNLLVATEAGEYSAGGYRYVYDDCYIYPPKGVEATTTSFGPERSPQLSVASDRLSVADSKINFGSKVTFGGKPRALKALVLSGGGAKGAFEAGAVAELWKTGYRPDIICGVSVGAVNAIKLAEGAPDSAEQLVAMWRAFSADRNAIFWRNYHLWLLEAAVQRALDSAEDAALWGGVAKLFMGLLNPVSMFSDDVTAVATTLLTAEANGLDDHLRRVLNLATMTHGMHCMEPLRRLITEHTRPALIRAAGTVLRLGISDAKSGTFFSVGEPIADGDLANYGYIDPEPDMALSADWLRQPAFGCKRFAMRLRDAVYASSIMPLFMEPMEMQLGSPRLVDTEHGRVGLLHGDVPEAVRNIVQAMSPNGEPNWSPNHNPIEHLAGTIDHYAERHGLPADKEARAAKIRQTARLTADGKRGRDSSRRVLFDGGLVDAVPLRTAMRLGATEILVVGVDEFGVGGQPVETSAPITQYSWLDNIVGGAGIMGGIDPATLPAVKYLFSTLGGFVHNTARNDVLAPLGVLDARRVGEIAREMLPADRHANFAQQVREAMDATVENRRDWLGGTTGLGGTRAMAYGDLSCGGVSVDMILPDRPLLDAQAFDDAAGVEEALELGRIAARDPIAM